VTEPQSLEAIARETERVRRYIESCAAMRLLSHQAVCATDIVDVWQANSDCLNSTCPMFYDRRQAFSDVQRALPEWAERLGLTSELRPSPNSGMNRRYYLRP
jgi:hypothetical protein